MWATGSGKALQISLACLLEASLSRSTLSYPSQDIWGKAALTSGFKEYQHPLISENKRMPSSLVTDPGGSLVLGLGRRVDC